MYQKYIKRIIDISIAIIAIEILLPLFLVCCIIIYIQDFGPVFFKQVRIGKNGIPFLFYKFRSMPVNTPNVPSIDVSKINITYFGKFIRRTSIDELPQLLNILKGDMSIVGPRPPIPTQQALIKFRSLNGSINCYPGLTGWAQINSYDFMTDEVKAAFDQYYSLRISFLFDLKIIIKTFYYLTKKPPIY